MGVLNVEIVGGLCIIYLMARMDNVFGFAHWLLKGVKFFLPPSDEDIAQLQPIVHKRMKKPPRQKSLLEKIETLNLQSIPIQQGLLYKQPLWDVYDLMLFAVMVAAINHVWCEVHNCFFGGTVGHEWPFWISMFALLLCIHAGVYAAMLVGFQRAEGRYATGCGIAAYMLATIVFYNFSDGFKVFAQQLLAFAQHLTSRPLGGEQIIVAASTAVLALIVAGLVGGMVVPAYRFSRLHLELQAAKETASARILFFIDIALPLLAGCAWLLGDKLPIPHSIIQLIQFSLTILFVCSRVARIRENLQQFTLGVRATLVPELAREHIDAKEIQDRVRARFQYIGIAASEYLAFPLAVVCLLLLFHSKGTLNFGVCAFVKSVTGLGDLAADEADGVEATGEASRTLMEIVEAHQDMATTVAALKVFFKSLSQHEILPPLLVGDVVSTVLGLTLACWFAIYTSCLFYWQFGGRLFANMLSLVTGEKLTKAD